MNEKKLRTEAEKLGYMVTDVGWGILEDQGYLQDALGKDIDEDQVAQIIKGIVQVRAELGVPIKGGARSFEGAESGPRAENGARPGPFAVELSDAERERALLLLEAQVRAETTHPRVTGFRERHLSDGLLSAEGAEVFLKSSDSSELDALADHLHRFHGWHKGEAAWWVLTGEAPSCRPVKVSYREAFSGHSPDLYLITVEAPPWISPATFRGAFAEMRRRMHAERKPPEARSVRAVRFVERLRNDPATKNLTFEEMCRRWNEDNPSEAFSEFRSFETAYRRTAKILRRQYNTEIEREETPELSRQRARRHALGSRQF
jgi:hypothetical protein